MKFQAQTAEEKEAWIKAFTDGINRAKNKVFDEVICVPTPPTAISQQVNCKASRFHRSKSMKA